MTFHMSVTKQEANFLKEILAKHLDDYVEEIAKEDKDNVMQHMMENRCLLYTSPSPRDQA